MDDNLLKVFLKLLASHAKFTDREYKTDPSYNNESMGYKEEKNAITAIQEHTGKDIITLMTENGIKTF